tara:strand:- start:201793 stop:203160 length:1368 start_codon:yes stop_codon:yes gene_type:complete
VKKTLSIFVLVLSLAIVAASIAGVSPSYMVNSPSMLTGMGAKLACSGHYVSGLSEEQAFIDLQSYSPALKLLDLEYDQQQKSVSASLLGVKTTRAQYREGLGCSLSIGDTQALDQVVVPEVVQSVEDWPIGSGGSAIESEWQTKLNSLMQEDNAKGLNTRALLLVKDGQLVAESYADGFDSGSKLLGWSMAKSVTALLVGHLEMTNLLDTQKQPVFDEWSEDQRRSIRFEDLLHMSSGLDFPETYEPGMGVTDMLFTANTAAELPLAAPLIHVPGEIFEYSSGTTNLFSKLIFERTGNSPQSQMDFLHQALREPLALQDFVFETDPSGVPVGSSYLYASARDWAKIGQLMLNRGELNGHRLVTEDWVDRALAPNKSTNTKSYGYQFWLNAGDASLRWPDLPQDSFAALGNRKQVVMVVPSKNAVIVRLGWTSGRYPTNENFAEILSMIEPEIPAS